MVAASSQFADGVPDSAVRLLTDIYQRAGQRLADLVVKPVGTTADARRFNRARAAALSKQIDAVLREVKGFAAAWTTEAASTAFATGLRTANRQLLDAGLPAADQPVQGGFSQLDRRTVAVIAADMAVSLDEAIGQQAGQARRFLRAASQTFTRDASISQVVAEGAVTGDVRGAYKAMRRLIAAGAIEKGAMAAEVAESYRKAGQQLITVGKATLTLKSYAEMLVRTRTREATVHARHERLLANDCDLVSVVGSLSENFCTAYLGRVFSITGRSDRYPSLAELPGGGPPFHPRCTKSTRAYIERFATDAQRRAATMRNEAFLTTDAAEAQSLYAATGELRNVTRRYQTVGAANV